LIRGKLRAKRGKMYRGAKWGKIRGSLWKDEIRVIVKIRLSVRTKKGLRPRLK